jgi:MFS family permease
MISGTALAILTSVFPSGERGRVIGINVAATYIGLSLGPFLGGFLTQNFGWRSIFLINIPIGLIVIAFIVWKLKGEWAGASGEPFDFPGSAIYGLTLVAIMYGISLLPSKSALLLIFPGIVGLFLFVIWETRINAPVLNMNLFRKNMVFAFSNLAALINYAATFAVTFLLSLYLQYIRGFSPQDSGLILICQPAVMALFSPFAGRLSDRTEPRIIASLGMGVTAIALFMFTFLGETTSTGVIIAQLIILGIGLAFFSSPNMNAIMSSVEKKFYGVASAMVGTMRLVGQTGSMGIVMVVFALYIGKVEIVPAYYQLFLESVKILFMVFGVLCGFGVLASVARGKMR